MPLDHLEKDLDKTHGDIEVMRQAIYTLIESQKNTTKNVDSLTADMKEIIKTSGYHDVHRGKITSIEKRLKKIEDAKTWEYRIFIAAVISAAGSLLAKMAFF